MEHHNDKVQFLEKKNQNQKILHKLEQEEAKWLQKLQLSQEMH